MWDDTFTNLQCHQSVDSAEIATLWDCDISDQQLSVVMDQYKHTRNVRVISTRHADVRQPISTPMYQQKQHAGLFQAPAHFVIHAEPAQKFASMDSATFDLDFSFHSTSLPETSQGDKTKTKTVFRKRKFAEPIANLEDLAKKQFAGETNKKISWAVNMYGTWQNECKTSQKKFLTADLDHLDNLTKEGLSVSLCQFVMEICKLDGSKFSTMYCI